MDEFLFRSSQKFEHLQYQMGVATAEGSSFIKQLSTHTKNALVDTLNSPTSQQIQETLRSFFLYSWELADEICCSIVYHVNPRNLSQHFAKVFRSKWSSRDLAFGCAGLIVGSVFGIGIGIAFQRKNVLCKHMLAVQCTSYIGIEGATVTDEAIAATCIKEHEILIGVRATSVQVIDADICNGYGKTTRQLLAAYQFSKHDLPVTLGRDCTGIVIDVGKKVTRFDIGDEVWTTSPFWAAGTMCQYFIAHESDVGHKPATIGYEGACSLPYAGGVALTLLKSMNLAADELRDKRILVQGCCTPVGCVLVQLFKVWEAHITTTCYRRAIPVAEALRCDDIIVFDACISTPPSTNGQTPTPTAALCTPEMEAVTLLQELQHRKTFDIVVNTRRCGVPDEQLRGFTSPGGVFISTLQTPLVEDSYRFPSSFLFRIYVRIRSMYQVCAGRQLRDYGEVHICSKLLDELKQLVEAGKLKTLVDKVYYPSDIENALYHIQSTDSIGSSIITFRCEPSHQQRTSRPK